MDKEAFIQLTQGEQLYRIMESGRVVATRQFLHCLIRCYALHDFYAEVWYVPAANKVKQVETLSLDEVLAIYKDDFDISGLLK